MMCHIHHHHFSRPYNFLKSPHQLPQQPSTLKLDLKSPPSPSVHQYSTLFHSQFLTLHPYHGLSPVSNLCFIKPVHPHSPRHSLNHQPHNRSFPISTIVSLSTHHHSFTTPQHRLQPT
jgi:hypothetical protein